MGQSFRAVAKDGPEDSSPFEKTSGAISIGFPLVRLTIFRVWIIGVYISAHAA
jgi:hypothetical protein